MRENLKIVKLGESEYRLGGDIDLFQTYRKSVIVDGERYDKTWREIESLDIDHNWDNNTIPDYWHKMELSLNGYMGIHQLVMWTYDNLHKYFPVEPKSENPLVSFIQILQELKLIPGIFHIGKRSDLHYSFHDLISMRKVPIQLFSYGFNNHVLINVPYHDVLKFDIPVNKTYFCDKVINILFPQNYEKFDWDKKAELLRKYSRELASI